MANVNSLGVVNICLQTWMWKTRTWTGQYLSCMWFDVKICDELASLCSKWSSKPNIGAGRTIVVSGKIDRTSLSPQPYPRIRVGLFSTSIIENKPLSERIQTGNLQTRYTMRHG